MILSLLCSKCLDFNLPTEMFWRVFQYTSNTFRHRGVTRIINRTHVVLCFLARYKVKSRQNGFKQRRFDGRTTHSSTTVSAWGRSTGCSRFSVYVGPNWYLRRVCNFSSSWHFTKFLDSSADFGRSKKIRDVEITGNKFLGWPAVQTPAPKLLLYNSLSVYNLLVDTTDLYMNQPLVTIFKKVITNFSGLQSPKIEACERFFLSTIKKVWKSSDWRPPS